MVMRYANDMPVATSTKAADLRVAVMRLARRLRQQLSEDDISTGQFSVLAVLATKGPRTPRELAETERVQPPSMTRTLNYLAAAGLVSRTDHPDDGRQVLIAVTERGLQVVEETRRRRTAWLAQRLAELTPDERATLTAASVIMTRLAES
jgi:DNA-binding MarR family transcriptional regulator